WDGGAAHAKQTGAHPHLRPPTSKGTKFWFACSWLRIEYEWREKVCLVLAQNKISINNIAARLLIFPAEARGGERLVLLFSADEVIFQNRFVDIAVLVVGIAVDVVKKQRVVWQAVMPHQCLAFAE